MNLTVNWNLFANVASEAKCRRIIEVIQPIIGHLEDVHVERYRKDTTMFKIYGTTALQENTAQDAVYKVMKILGGLSRAWIVSSPSEEDGLEFGGASQPGSISVQGVDSVSFKVLPKQPPRQVAYPPSLKPLVAE